MFASLNNRMGRSIAIAAAMLAVGSMVGVSSASAMKGERGKGKRQIAKSERKAKKNRNVARNRAAPRVHIQKERRNDRIKRNVKRAIGIIASGVLNEPRVIYHDYGPRRGFSGRRYNDFCVAVARTRGGYGRRLPIRAEGHGRRACRKAMRRCNRRLDFRQSTGRNPYAACVVARRR